MTATARLSATSLLQRLARTLCVVVAAGLAACADMPGPPGDTLPGGPLPGQTEPGGPVLTPEQKEAAAELPDPVLQISPQTSAARAYRKNAAHYLYEVYAKRVYMGKMPPLVHAVAVVETHLDARGNVRQVTFMRAPTHAPEVSLEISQLIKKASPLPMPGNVVGAHTYVDTWLWDKSGKFQIDTLTEGQRGR